MTSPAIQEPLLELESMIGFDGKVKFGLKVHPNKSHIIYSVGCTVVIEDIKTKEQSFLFGHTNGITALTVSKCGTYLASGQKTHMGYKADIIVWDYAEKKLIAKLSLHKVKVEDLTFSPNGQYLISLGGKDDGTVVVWDMNKMEAICGSPAQCQSAGDTCSVIYANKNDYLFATCGSNTLRIWELDVQNRKIRPTEANLGQLRRIFSCMVFDADDMFLITGTQTGDIIAVNVNTKLLQFQGPKPLFSCGINCLSLLPKEQLVVGAGDGTVCIIDGFRKSFKRVKSVKVKGSVSSISLRGVGHQFYVGTEESSIFRFQFADLSYELLMTCHNEPVNDICFPMGSSELFGTASKDGVRLWNASKNSELLRIVVHNKTCNAMQVMLDGKSIITGWDDGRIRAFYPESGKPMYTIEDAHKLGVTALSTYTDCAHIVSGGQNGDVRVWRITPEMGGKETKYTTKLCFMLKEHKAGVTCIKMRSDDSECVSSSIDGSCIIWDLKKMCRCQMVIVNTLFKYVCYHPNEHQIIATGTDSKIGYFETYDGSTIRELEGSKSGSINGMDISACGKYFVSGGDDRLIKVWVYDDGVPTHIGLGHGAGITRVKISPDGRYILSVSMDGAILRWKFPHVLSV